VDRTTLALLLALVAVSMLLVALLVLWLVGRRTPGPREGPGRCDPELHRRRRRVGVRIGIHYGDVVHRDNDIFGRNVAHAARVAALASGGEILVSDTVASALEGCEDITLAEPREVQLKGLAGDHYVASVDLA
jgi:Adenylate and Guanylate cyclase catalytic domain